MAVNVERITLGGGCFWCTEAVRQEADAGTQYRSGMYLASPGQKAVVREVLAEAQTVHKKPIVTEVLPAQNYSTAEASYKHHYQHYCARTPDQGYGAFVVAPKVDKFRSTFAGLTRE